MLSPFANKIILDEDGYYFSKDKLTHCYSPYTIKKTTTKEYKDGSLVVKERAILFVCADPRCNALERLTLWTIEEKFLKAQLQQSKVDHIPHAHRTTEEQTNFLLGKIVKNPKCLLVDKEKEEWADVLFYRDQDLFVGKEKILRESIGRWVKSRSYEKYNGEDYRGKSTSTITIYNCASESCRAQVKTDSRSVNGTFSDGTILLGYAEHQQHGRSESEIWAHMTGIAPRTKTVTSTGSDVSTSTDEEGPSTSTSTGSDVSTRTDEEGPSTSTTSKAMARTSSDARPSSSAAKAQHHHKRKKQH